MNSETCDSKPTVAKHSDGSVGCSELLAVPWYGIPTDRWVNQLPTTESCRQKILAKLTDGRGPGRVYPYNKYWALRSFLNEARYRVSTHGLRHFIAHQLSVIQQKILSAGFLVKKLSGFNVHKG